MLSLEMLDVAIGMIFVYLLVSLICSAVNELVEAKLKLRAVDLEQGIRELLNDLLSKEDVNKAKSNKEQSLVEKLYAHPLVSSLFRGKYDVTKIRAKKASKDTRYKMGSDLPSYIPARNFALAILDLTLPSLRSVSSTVPGNSNSLQPVLDEINKIPNAQLQTALKSIVTDAGNNIGKIRAGIENWYNSSMDRVAGWYKRRIQTIMFWLGLTFVLFLNADSIAIFSNLVNDRPLRSAIVDASQRVQAAGLKDSTRPSVTAIRKDVDSLYTLGLPIGWNWKSTLNNNPEAIPNVKAIPAFNTNDATTIGASLWLWFLKVIGWCITAFAISLGAPFWFDVLNRIMVVRSTVKPTEKSPDESSQDRQKTNQ